MRRVLLILAAAVACRSTAAEDDPSPARPQSVTSSTPAASAEAIAEARGRSDVKSDERVQLFPTVGWREGSAWRVQLHGWIHEPELDSWRRAAFVETMAAALGTDAAGSELFASRMRPFTYDNERGKRVECEVAGEIVPMPSSGPDGHFSAIATIDGGVPPGPTRVVALTRPGDAREFASSVFLVPPEGLTVISDIDDTVKISDVTDKEALLRRTFLEPFEVVPEMAERYRQWLDARPGSHLHFVSASPWQLYPALAQMLDDAGFPAASFSLKTVRLKDPHVLEVLASTKQTKVDAISEHIGHYPKRRFALVGDSGEHDPEVYGEIARKFGEQVVYIAIRNVTGDDPSSSRYADAFGDVSARWELFSDPSALQGPP